MSPRNPYVVLTGGTGGAKFVAGLAHVVAQEDITCIVNTGDDLDWWGLRVCPDLDSITYVLSGRLSRERGWGVEGDTFQCRDAMKDYGLPAWFSVGDKDLAVHLLRTQLLRAGKPLHQATEEVATRLGATARILPASNDPVETRIGTPEGELAFEEYFVGRRFQVPVHSVHFRGAESARPAPGVLEAIATAAAIFIAPSNPVTSIGPIVAVPGIREALTRTAAPVIAVSPIVGKAAVSGPAAALMAAHGLEVSLRGVAQAYHEYLDAMVADESDRAEGDALAQAGLHVHFTSTIMRNDEDKTRLAQSAVTLAGQLSRRSRATQGAPS
jgi:LPPG:FO 2-phospho-L-lactate transferase